MNIVAAIVAGLAGTAVMTAMMYVAPSMGMPRMDIPNMLGATFVEPDGNAIGLGAVAHFMMGAIFGIVYALLWTTVGIGAAGWLWGLIFGVVHGLVAIVAMPIMMGNLHPRPPEMEQGPMTIVGLIAGHAVFGIIVGLVYAGMA